MDRLTIVVIIFAVIAILFLFVLFFIWILKLQRKAKLEVKIALMQGSNSAPESVEKFGTRKSSIKRKVSS